MQKSHGLGTYNDKSSKKKWTILDDSGLRNQTIQKLAHFRRKVPLPLSQHASIFGALDNEELNNASENMTSKRKNRSLATRPTLLYALVLSSQAFGLTTATPAAAVAAAATVEGDFVFFFLSIFSLPTINVSAVEALVQRQTRR